MENSLREILQDMECMSESDLVERKLLLMITLELLNIIDNLQDRIGRLEEIQINMGKLP